MSYTAQQTTAQSLSGVISLTDGVLTIEDGKISNVGSLDVIGDARIEGSLEVIGTIVGNVDLVVKDITSSEISNCYKSNTAYLNSTKVNVTKMKSALIVSNVGNIKEIYTQKLILSNPSTPTQATPGIPGEIKYDSSYLYLYNGSAWKRVTLNSF